MLVEKWYWMSFFGMDEVDTYFSPIKLSCLKNNSHMTPFYSKTQNKNKAIYFYLFLFSYHGVGRHCDYIMKII